jgi:ribonuclease Z
MEFVLLGTGCPQCDPLRMGPANLVRHADRAVLIDCGSGVTQRLVEAGTPGAALDAVLLTHLHSDHVVDLYQLIVSSWHQGRARPQRIFGPPGTRRFVDGLMALWAPERAQRIAHELRPSTEAFEIAVTELVGGETWSEGGMRIHAVAVAHQPVAHALGFVCEAEGRKLAFSGDTAYCPALIAAARGADALVHECFIHREMKPSPSRSAEGLRNVAAYHTLSGEVGRVAGAAEVKLLVLNHFVPTRFDRAALVAELRQTWRGPLVIGEDLMRYDCATRELVYRDARLGFALD